MDTESIRRAIADRLTFTIGKDTLTATELGWLNSVFYAIRDRLIERWMNTMRSYYACDTKRVYYLSLEFLIGRTLLNAMLNLGIEQECCQVERTET